MEQYIFKKKIKNIYIIRLCKYNYTNQNSKFYKNVEIKYDNKIITCDNFDLKYK